MKPYPLCGCKPTAYSGTSQTAVHTCEGQRDQVLTYPEWSEYLQVQNALAYAKASHPSNYKPEVQQRIDKIQASIKRGDKPTEPGVTAAELPAFLAEWQEIDDDGGEL